MKTCSLVVDNEGALDPRKAFGPWLRGGGGGYTPQGAPGRHHTSTSIPEMEETQFPAEDVHELPTRPNTVPSAPIIPRTPSEA